MNDQVNENHNGKGQRLRFKLIIEFDPATHGQNYGVQMDNGFPLDVAANICAKVHNRLPKKGTAKVNLFPPGWQRLQRLLRQFQVDLETNPS